VQGQVHSWFVWPENAALPRSIQFLFAPAGQTARATEAGDTVTVVAVLIEPPVTEIDREVLRQFKGTGNIAVALRPGQVQNARSVEPTGFGTEHAETIEDDQTSDT
jgi:transcription termination factor Rho